MTDDTTIDLDASRAEANRLLAEAGWAPHPVWGSYAKGTLVAGLQPDGQAFHVKDWAAIPPGHPHYGPDTPDEPHEAARWLIAKFGPVAVHAEPESLGSDILAAEEEMGESLTDTASDNDVVLEAPATSESGLGGDAAQPDDAAEIASEADAIDAHWTEPDYVRLVGEDLNLTPALPDDHVSEEGQGGDEGSSDFSGQDRFIGLDDLDRRRSLRIGDVATKAARLVQAIEDVAAEQPDEFASVQGYVTTHLDKHTGAFTGDNQAVWDRFIELSDARGAVAAIEQHRKNVTAMLLTGNREFVERFDPEAGWP